MVNATISFPIYRKYEGDFSFFKITGADSFIELKVMGKSISKTSFKAKILPDYQFINDMINLHSNHWIVSNENEFNEVFRNVPPL